MHPIFRKAEQLLRHPEQLRLTLSTALQKAYAKRGILLQVFEEFLQIFRLLKAWVLGEYPEVPRKTLLWAVLAVLYFLSPLDAIPDIFPGGYIDDIAVIGFILKRIRGDLERFRDWEKRNDMDSP